jgi:hypothetical protein
MVELLLCWLPQKTQRSNAANESQKSAVPSGPELTQPKAKQLFVTGKTMPIQPLSKNEAMFYHNSRQQKLPGALFEPGQRCFAHLFFHF